MRVMFIKKALFMCFLVCMMFLASCSGSSDNVQDAKNTPPETKANFSNGSYNFKTDGVDVIMSQNKLEVYTMDMKTILTKLSDTQFNLTANSGDNASPVLLYTVLPDDFYTARLSTPTTTSDFITIDSVMLSDGNNMAFAGLSHDIANPTDNSADAGTWVLNHAMEITADSFVGTWTGRAYSDPNIRNSAETFKKYPNFKMVITKISFDEIKVDIYSENGQIESIQPVKVLNGRGIIEAPVITADSKKFIFSLMTDGKGLSFHMFANELNDELDVNCTIGLLLKQ